MNCPSRPDEFDAEAHPDWNQCPPQLSSDATTRADLNGIVNRRALRHHDTDSSIHELDHDERIHPTRPVIDPDQVKMTGTVELCELATAENSPQPGSSPGQGGGAQPSILSAESRHSTEPSSTQKSWSRQCRQTFVKYCRFVGPGFLIAVAYIDPGNYATDVQAGAETRFAHLFIVLLSNLIAIFLQTLCIKLGTVTGLDLAEACREYMPTWAVWILYVLSEGAIIATDIAEVIGTAIALNLLFKLPLVAGCAVSLADVFILLLFYNPDGGFNRLRIFEAFIVLLVLGVVVCFCIELKYIRDTSAGEVFKGYLPSSALVVKNGVYLSCGILGATVMPHSIFLGSGLVKPRLRQFDLGHDDVNIQTLPQNRLIHDLDEKYRPSIGAIRSCLRFSVVELATQLFTFALFVNSAILIIAGTFLYGNDAAADADLFGIHDLLVRTIAPAAGILFALALLMSGTSAGIVCTMAGQMVSEGMIQWRLKPWVRRLVTRSISIVPSIVVAGAVGRSGLNAALTNSQVALSVALPFVTAPLLWFTCSSKIMTVYSDADGHRLHAAPAGRMTGVTKVNMRNNLLTAAIAISVWLFLVVMNVALIVLAALGRG